VWVDTHQIVRGPFGPDSNPSTIKILPGMITTIPAIGLPVPNSYPILIPLVPPGTYRVIDSIAVISGSLDGFVIVQVR